MSTYHCARSKSSIQADSTAKIFEGVRCNLVHMSARTILVLGANPAWQRVVESDRVSLGDVVRVRRLATCPAGKGMNCAQALAKLGSEPLLIGGCGTEDASWEHACHDEGVATASFPLDGTVRMALTVLDRTTGESTEIVETGPAASPGADTFLELIVRQRLSNARVLVVSGSFPSGLSAEGLVSAWEQSPVDLVLDSLPAVRALPARAHDARVVLKLNLAEWRNLLGEGLEEDLLRIAQERWPGTEVVATLGRLGCAARRRDGSLLRRQPTNLPSDQTIYPIGAGDAFTAGLAFGVSQNASLDMAVQEGLAVARASCLHPMPARFHDSDLLRMREDLRISEFLG